MSKIKPYIELIRNPVNTCTIHGWNTGRLFRQDGTLYFAANVPRPSGNDDADWAQDRGLIFHRPEGADRWEERAEIPPRFYTGCVDGDGRCWIVDPQEFSRVKLWRTRAAMNFEKLDLMYQGTCAYLGAGVSPDNSFLFMHAEDTNHTVRFPNAMIGVYYDRPTDSYHLSRIETPQGRFGYVGIIQTGRKAIALLQLTQYDPEVEPNEPYYNWRMIKLVRCDDLIEGKWTEQPVLERAFGQTQMQDMMRGPDGMIYTSCKHRGGDESYEVTQELPFTNRIIRVAEDLSFETFFPDIDSDSTRLFFDSRGHMYAVGRNGGILHLWKLDIDDGMKVTSHWPLEGTEKMAGGIMHTLRPERFGGEGDGDTIHLATSNPDPGGFGSTVRELELWYTRFELPVDSA